uniref:CID domain-containing protein n=1 Tax=Oryzias latipes TaxID=8090 RepID=A0A3P9LYF3_ORYLA
MAAGAKAASGGSFEATLERRFRTVSNTMDSIQGLSTWCIDNKKYHSLIVRRSSLRLHGVHLLLCMLTSTVIS